MNITGIMNTTLNVLATAGAKSSSEAPLSFKIESAEQIFIPPANSLRKASDSMSLPELAKNSYLSPESYKSYMEGLANNKDTKAIVRLDGKIISIFDHGGAVTSRNWAGDLVLDASGDFNTITNSLRNRYGSRIGIETFNPGEGPTNAKVFEAFNGKKYDEFVQEQFDLQQKDIAEGLEQAKRYEEQRDNYNQANQQSVISVNGTVVGSIGENGGAEIHMTTLTQQVESHGYSRESVAELKYQSLGATPDIKSIEATLREMFGDELQIEKFSGENMPTRSEVAATASNQYWKAYEETNNSSSLSKGGINTSA